MAPTDEVKNETEVAVDAVPARGETGVVQHVDDMAYSQEVDSNEVDITESDIKVEIGASTEPDFQFNYNMDAALFDSLWNMTINKNDNTLKRLVASKVITTYINEHLTEPIDLDTISKTTLGKAKKFFNQHLLSIGEDSLAITDVVKLLVRYRIVNDLPPIIVKILKETVYKEDAK